MPTFFVVCVSTSAHVGRERSDIMHDTIAVKNAISGKCIANRATSPTLANLESVNLIETLINN